MGRGGFGLGPGGLEGRPGGPAGRGSQGSGRDIADFGVIWGRNFFDQKSTFFNFDFDKKWFGGGLDPLAQWVEKKIADFFFP